MAGSVFAGENYFYMDDITLTKEEAAEGCAKVVNVKAHFDEAVSAWQAFFTLPEGVTITAHSAGSGLTISYLGKFEDEETLESYYQQTTHTPTIRQNADKTQVVVSMFTTTEFDEAGNEYALCYRPGDYEQMWRIRLVFPAGFKGGDIALRTEPSCSQGIMPGLTPCVLDAENPPIKTTKVRIKADTPVITVAGDDYSKTVTITAEEGATIYYSTDGETYQVYTEPVVFDEAGTYTVYAYAEGPGEEPERKSKSDVAQSDEFTIAEQVDKPTITFSGEETTTMTVTVKSEGADALIVNGEEHEGDTYSYTVTRADVYTEGTVEVTAQAKKGNVLSEEVTESKAWVVQSLTPFDATVTVTRDGNLFTLYYRTVLDPNPTVNVTVTVNDEPVDFEFQDGWHEATDPSGSPDGGMTATYNHHQFTEPGTYEVKVTLTVGPGTGYAGDPVSDSETWKYTINNKFEGEIVFGDVDPETGKIHVSYSGTEEDYNMLINLNGQPAELDEDGNLQLAEGENKIVVIVYADGYDNLTDEANPVWTKPLQPAPAPTLSWDPETFTMTAIAPDANHQVKLYMALLDEDGNVMSTVPLANPYTVKQTDEEQTWTFIAETLANDDESGNTMCKPMTVTIPAKTPTLAGEIQFSEVDQATGQFTVTYTGTEEGVTLTLDDESITLLRDVVNKYQLPDYGTYPVTATAAAEGYESITKDATLVWKAPVVLELPKPTIDVTNDAANQTTVITIELPEDAPEGTILDYTLTDEEGNVIPVSDYSVAATDGKIVITIPNGDEIAFVNVTAITTMTEVPEGYDAVKDGEANKTVEVPQYQQTAAPTIDVSFAGEEGHYYANVTFVNNDEDKDAVIEYSLDGGDTWNTYTGAPVVINQDGDHTVLARATAEGKATSEETERSFNLNQTATGVGELVNGKTVAGVRYFNMAGQEMQEANGMTIVVTTYTDGTSTAVKVMK